MKVSEKQLKNLIALRDAVLEFHKEAEEAVKEDREVNFGGNGINCCEAIGVLRPLKELADKCKK